MQKTLKKYGFIVLSNSSVKIKNIYIAGVEDMQTGTPDVQKALENTKPPVILLTHNPDIYYDINQKVDLILAGHVHGGQVKIPFLGAMIVPSKYGAKFAEGIIEENHNKMIITKGLGTSILPVRFRSTPEIIVLENKIE